MTLVLDRGKEVVTLNNYEDDHYFTFDYFGYHFHLSRTELRSSTSKYVARYILHLFILAKVGKLIFPVY